jgi:hypothetical protein
MAFTSLITLNSPGASSGPFDLLSDANGFSSAFESSVPKSYLTSGYTSNLVPDGTTIIRVQSTGTCTNFINLAVSGIPATTTTTTTTTTTAAPVIIPVQYILNNNSATSVIVSELRFYKNGSEIQLINADGNGTINYALNDTIRVTFYVNFPPPGGNHYLDIYDQAFNPVFIDSSGSNTLLDSGNILLDSLSGITNLEVYGYY